jgi:hypothetical protein
LDLLIPENLLALIGHSMMEGLNLLEAVYLYVSFTSDIFLSCLVLINFASCNPFVIKNMYFSHRLF